MVRTLASGSTRCTAVFVARCSQVRLVYHKQKGAKTPFALKCLQKGQLIKFKQVEHVINEKNVLDQCCHPFILKLEATFNGVNQVYMLLEVALGGELFTHLRRVGKYLPSQVSTRMPPTPPPTAANCASTST